MGKEGLENTHNLTLISKNNMKFCEKVFQMENDHPKEQWEAN